MNNCSDAMVECNCIKDNRIGVKHERKFVAMDAINGSNLFRQNNFEKNRLQNVKVTHGAWWSSKKDSGFVGGLYLGVVGDSRTGENRFERFNGATDNVGLYVWEWDRVDSAHANTWYDEVGTAPLDSAAADTTNYYRGVIGQNIEVDQVGSENPGCSYGSPACDLPAIPLGGGTTRGLAEAVAPTAGDRQGGGVTDATEEVDLPVVFALFKPRPNPAAGYARIDLDVPRDNQGAVEVMVYDVRGRRVKALLSSRADPGRYSLRWDLRDDGGGRIASGVYFVRMVSEGYCSTEKLVLLR